MRIAIYARKSTESEDRQVQSLDDQLQALAKLAEREGIQVTERYVESRSAKAPGNRPEFTRLISDIEDGKVDGVLTWSINRLSRNPVDGGQIAYLLQTGRLNFIKTIDRTYRPEDNALLMSIENGMATAYLQDLKRNVLRGMEGKAQRGWHVCKAPVGYRNDPETREIVVDEERAPLVRYAFDQVLNTSRTIADIYLDVVDRGLTVRSRRRATGPISRTRFGAILVDSFYSGLVRFRGKEYPGRHEPLLTPAEFSAVQRALGQRKWPTKPSRHHFPFSGAMYCGDCGCAVVGEVKERTLKGSGAVATYRYYHCSAWKGCKRRSVTEDYVHGLFRIVIQSFALREPVAAWLKRAYAELVESDTINVAQDSGALASQIQAEQRRLTNLTAMRLNEEITGAEYVTLRGELEGTISRLERRQLEVSDTVQRELDYVSRRLDQAVQAGDLAGEPDDPRALGMFMPLVAECRLENGIIQVSLDPLLQQIATFELPRDSSGSPKAGDVLPHDSVWWALVHDLRNIAAT